MDLLDKQALKERENKFLDTAEILFREQKAAIVIQVREGAITFCCSAPMGA